MRDVIKIAQAVSVLLNILVVLVELVTSSLGNLA